MLMRMSHTLMWMLVGLIAFGPVSLLADEDKATATEEAKDKGSEVADDSDKSDDNADKPEEAEEEVDIYAIPEDADAAGLLEFIKNLKKFRPKTAEEFFAHRRKSPKVIAEAANKIMELESDETSAAYQEAKGIVLGTKARELMNMEPEEQKKTLEEIIAHIGSKESVGGEEASLASSAARYVEYSGNTDLAVHAYKSFAKLLSKSDDERIADYGQMLKGAARRVGLVGKEMQVSGTTLEGEAFDLKDLEGKVVLVDFWATWCGPCVGEIPNMKEQYDLYHDQGFEIVGVSIDRTRAALDKFLEEKPVPWMILHESDKDGKNEATKTYGIMGIPAMFLIGKDGKVVSTKARGEELNQLLKGMFDKT